MSAQLELWKERCAHFMPTKPKPKVGGLVTAEKSAEVDLGIAVSGALLLPGQVRSAGEIALFAGCSKQAIHQIEMKAMKKLRDALASDPHLKDEIRHGLLATHSSSVYECSPINRQNYD